MTDNSTQTAPKKTSKLKVALIVIGIILAALGIDNRTSHIFSGAEVPQADSTASDGYIVSPAPAPTAIADTAKKDTTKK